MTPQETTASIDEILACLAHLGCVNQDVSDALVAVRPKLEQMGINNAYRWASFLAQTAVESAGFNATRENMNYSADGLMRTWPKRFANRAKAQALAAQGPRAIANAVYNGRMSNRVGSDDGWNYRGGGFGHLTGRANYQRIGGILGIDLEENPGQIETCMETAWLSFAAFFVNATQGGVALLTLADQEKHEAISRGVNGGTLGMLERMAFSREALAILLVDEGVTKVPVLSAGSRGPAVRALQRLLKQVGYNIKPDGAYGPAVHTAVVNFQMTHGLKVQAAVTVETFRALCDVISEEF